MRDEHVNLEIEDLRVDVEVIGDALVDDDVPHTRVELLFRRVPVDAISPLVPHLTNLEAQRLYWNLFLDEVRVYNKLEEKLIEVGEDVDALPFYIIAVIDEHEVRVDFPATILAHNDRHIVSLLRGNVSTADGPISEQR